MSMLRLSGIVGIAILFFFSCNKEKDKWKLPTDVEFRVDVNRSTTKNGNLSFTGGTIEVVEFEFKGKREQGEDTQFSKSFDNGLIIKFDQNSPIPELQFDIPQGTYTNVEVEVEAEGKTDKSIIVEGTYISSSNDTIPLRLELESVEIYTLIAKNKNGASQIVLDKDIASSALIKFDPVHWFGTITTTMLDDASLVDVDGTQTIVISDAHNGDIFDKIEDRIDEATEVMFD